MNNFRHEIKNRTRMATRTKGEMVQLFNSACQTLGFHPHTGNLERHCATE